MSKLTICSIVGKSSYGPFNNLKIIDSSDSFYEIFGFSSISIERKEKMKKIMKK